MANLKIQLVKSLSGKSAKQIATANSLGLRKIGDEREQPDNACTRGKIKLVSLNLGSLNTADFTSEDAQKAQNIVYDSVVVHRRQHPQRDGKRHRQENRQPRQQQSRRELGNKGGKHLPA